MDKIWFKTWLIPMYHKCENISINDNFTYCYKGKKVWVIPTNKIIHIYTKEG